MLSHHQSRLMLKKPGNIECFPRLGQSALTARTCGSEGSNAECMYIQMGDFRYTSAACERCHDQLQEGVVTRYVSEPSSSRQSSCLVTLFLRPPHASRIFCVLGSPAASPQPLTATSCQRYLLKSFGSLTASPLPLAATSLIGCGHSHINHTTTRQGSHHSY